MARSPSRYSASRPVSGHSTSALLQAAMSALASGTVPGELSPHRWRGPSPWDGHTHTYVVCSVAMVSRRGWLWGAAWGRRAACRLLWGLSMSAGAAWGSGDVPQGYMAGEPSVLHWDLPAVAVLEGILQPRQVPLLPVQVMVASQAKGQVDAGVGVPRRIRRQPQQPGAQRPHRCRRRFPWGFYPPPEPRGEGAEGEGAKPTPSTCLMASAAPSISCVGPWWRWRPSNPTPAMSPMPFVALFQVPKPHVSPQKMGKKQNKIRDMKWEHAELKPLTPGTLRDLWEVGGCGRRSRAGWLWALGRGRGHRNKA